MPIYQNRIKPPERCFKTHTVLSPAPGGGFYPGVLLCLPASTSLGQPLDWELLPAGGERVKNTSSTGLSISLPSMDLRLLELREGEKKKKKKMRKCFCRREEEGVKG